MSIGLAQDKVKSTQYYYISQTTYANDRQRPTHGPKYHPLLVKIHHIQASSRYQILESFPRLVRYVIHSFHAVDVEDIVRGL